MKPLVKWSGGKSDEIKRFEKHFPENYDTYLEPFVGGGSVYFHLNPPKAVISDVHTELIAFYRAMAEGKARDIYDFMQNHPNDSDTYYRVREMANVAERFYYLRKTCFRGMLRYSQAGKFNIPFGRYKSIAYNDLLKPEYTDLLRRTTILNEPFERVFAEYNSERNFMFLDPPYDTPFTDYGYCKFGQENHRALADLFKSTRIRCLMVIGKTPFIEALYREYIVEEYPKRYRFKLYAGRIGEEINATHLVIKNFK